MRITILPLLLATLALPGCGSLLVEGTADGAGIAGAGLASSFTRNGAAAAAVGLGVTSLANEGLRYVERRVHRNEQDAIAAAAGPLEPGAVARWSIRHTLPIERDEHGDVTVSRVFGSGAITCKEVVFSVETTRSGTVRRAFYITNLCRDGQANGTAWRWAAAEPATERWSSMQ